MKKLLVCPDYRLTNPYQSLLYSEICHDVNISYINYDDLNDIYEYEFFHLHWVHGFYAHCKNEEEAGLKCDYVISKIQEYVDQGGVFIWTIHNLISHDSKFPDVERDFNEKLGELAYTVFVHNKTLIQIVNQSYFIDREKITLIEHGNYIEVYPNEISREDARKKLDIEYDERVFLFLGQIRPYKGINELLSAFSKLLSKYSKIKLIIAGQAVHPIGSGELSQLSSIESIIVNEGVVADDDLQIYFNAADYCVLPYRNILTSGSVINSLSFGCPVIGPKRGALSEIVQSGINGYLYDIDSKNALFETMDKALTHFSSEMREASIESARKLSWKRTNSKILKILERTNADFAIDKNLDIDAEVINHPINSYSRSSDLSIVILTYNNQKDVLRLIKSLRKSEEENNYNVVIVDNNSTSLSKNLLKHYFSDCYVLKCSENFGYAKGNNIGIKFAIDYLKSNWVLISNPDMVYLKDSITTLYNYAKSSGTKLLAPLNLRNDSDNIWSAGADIVFNDGVKVDHIGSGEVYYDYYNKEPYEVDYIAGSCILASKEVFKEVGFIPEDYFLYYEETDWCLKCRDKGYIPIVKPQSLVRHHKSSEPQGKPPKDYYIYYYIRNTFIFSQKFTSLDNETVHENLNKRFITPWLEKIRNNFSSELVDKYERLVEKAVLDGKNGVTGKTLVENCNTDLKGRVDSVSAYRNSYVILGWIMYANDDERTLEVDIYVNHRFVGTARADSFRQDLCEAQVSVTGLHGFRFEINKAYFLDGDNFVSVKYDGQLLRNKSKSIEVHHTNIKQVKSRIDGINRDTLQGWIINENNLLDKLNFELYCNDTYLGTFKSNSFRQDLCEVFKFDGKHGFVVKLPYRFLDNKPKDFTIKILDDNNRVIDETSKIISSNRKISYYDREMSLDQWLFLNRNIDVHDPYFKNSRQYFDNLKNIFLGQNKVYNSYKPLISIVMPTYNRVSTIKLAIDSVIEQSYDYWELIISDDGSIDGTVEFIRENYDDERIKVIDSLTNEGVSVARNRGLASTNGELITYLDSDNYWDPDYLKITTLFYSLYPERSCTYAGQEVREYFRIDKNTVLDDVTFLRLGSFNFNLLLNKNYIDLNVFSHRRSLYDSLGGFDEEMRRLVDWDLIIRYTESNHPIYIPFILSHYYMGYADNQITSLESHGRAYYLLAKKRDEIRRELYSNSAIFNKSSESDKFKIAIALKVNDEDSSILQSLEKTVTSICMSANISDTLVDIYIPDGVSITESIYDIAFSNVRILTLKEQSSSYDAYVKLEVGFIIANDFCINLLSKCLNSNKPEAFIPTTINLSSNYDISLIPYASDSKYLDITIDKSNANVIDYNELNKFNSIRTEFKCFKNFRSIILYGFSIEPNDLLNADEGFINTNLMLASAKLLKANTIKIFSTL